MILEEAELNTRRSLVQYIANNLYRLGNSPSTNVNSMILLSAAASLLNSGDDSATFASAKRLVQLAITTQKRK